MVTVKVVHKSTGKPAKAERVSIGFSAITRGVASAEYTDDDGEAHFDADPGEGTVYVHGQSRFTGRIAGRVVVYI